MQKFQIRNGDWGGVGALDRLGALFGKTRVAIPTIANEAGDLVTGSYELRSNRGQWEVVGETMALPDKSVRRPPRPMITRAKDPSDAIAIAVLDDTGEIPLDVFTGTDSRVGRTSTYSWCDGEFWWQSHAQVKEHHDVQIREISR